MSTLLASLRLYLAALLVCSCAYPLVVLGFAKTLCPDSANGSLVVRADGSVAGSLLLAQAFTQERYFWPRPSAAAYDAASAAGSNLSPTNPALAERARGALAAHGATASRPLPADLAAASGSGLDPHVSEAAARYQVPRVARARGIPEAAVLALVERSATSPGGAASFGRFVNVLALNLALDAMR